MLFKMTEIKYKASPTLEKGRSTCSHPTPTHDITARPGYAFGRQLAGGRSDSAVAAATAAFMVRCTRVAQLIVIPDAEGIRSPSTVNDFIQGESRGCGVLWASGIGRIQG